jgi:hypothetical protein
VEQRATEARCRRRAPARLAAMQRLRRPTWRTEKVRAAAAKRIAAVRLAHGGVVTRGKVVKERRRGRSDGEGRSDTRVSLLVWRL